MFRDMNADELKQEKELEKAIESFGYYQGDLERSTIDGEWTESELEDDVLEEAMKILKGDGKSKGWLEINKYARLKNKDLKHEEFIKNIICDEHDLVEIYNELIDNHRNDEKMLFGIHYFDEWCHKEINKILENNIDK